MPKRSHRATIIFLFLVSFLFIGSSPARASVTLGQLAPGSPPAATCGTLSQDLLQPTVTSGASYVVPGNGTITSWSTNAYANEGQMWTMKIFRKISDPATYQVVGHEGPRTLTSGALNSFPASIPVYPGDVLGMNDNDGSAKVNTCGFDAAGDQHLFRTGALAGGQQAPFSTNNDRRLNISAVFAPTNSFGLGATTRNKKKGTATITTNVPNPGTLTASGKGVKFAGAAGAVISKTLTAPGEATLLIKAKGKKKKTLNSTGKVKLKVAITYTPTGGDPNTQSAKVKLKKT